VNISRVKGRVRRASRWRTRCSAAAIAAPLTAGIGVYLSSMIHVDQTGAIQLTRADGKSVILGVHCVRCRYVGEMKYEAGFAFMPAPEQINEAHFRHWRR
jgi:hypothetical protein